MIDDQIRELIEQGHGFAVIMAGSGSDDKPKQEGKPSHIEKIADSLEFHAIPYDVRVCSAHKQPDKLMEMIGEYNQFNQPLAIIAVAGGTDALSGTVSYHSLHPVISCPPDVPNESCLTNPPGSSNAYIARPENVGKFLSQMFSSVHPGARDLLNDRNYRKVESLQGDDITIRQKYQRRLLKID
ncbi:hypothetical protein CEE44_01690 [Candidatus Woesearchaeota archaeon B3_Woes]|nr:MAG: hypothetical protein CEE44_01690 [Candidatus Woesearchaeota archaeon B3_Woes]